MEPLEMEESRNTVETAPTDGGHIRFYGLFWSRKHVDFTRQFLLGQSTGWVGQGTFAKDADLCRFQMNFWKTKGVYILYDGNLQPVYAGQAGLTRKKKGEGQSIGDRLNDHFEGTYRHGWRYFSWFSFLDCEKIKLRDAPEAERMNPRWEFKPRESDLNEILASFEAIVVEAFAPRFNARGGDLKKALFLHQYRGHDAT
jgi:hypothetical protein